MSGEQMSGEQMSGEQMSGEQLSSYRHIKSGKNPAYSTDIIIYYKRLDANIFISDLVLTIVQVFCAAFRVVPVLVMSTLIYNRTCL